MGLSCSKRNWLALSLAGLMTSSVYAAPYQIIDLGTLGGDTNFAFSLNELNEVVGSSSGRALEEDEVTDENPGEFCVSGTGVVLREYCVHAYMYRNATITDLGQFDQDGSFAFSINNNSIAVGYGVITLDDGDPETVADPVTEQAFVSIDGMPIQSIRFPDEAINLTDGLNPVMRAAYISDNNEITGLAFIAVPTTADPDVFVATTRPYIYYLDNDTFQIIPPFVEDDFDFTGTGRSINASGQLVGWGTLEIENGTATQGLLWDPASPELSQPLGTLGGFTSQAYDINDNGIIVGQSDTDENFFRNEELAFVYDSADSSMTRLPEFSTVPEFTNSVAYAVNNANQVVGSAQSSVSANESSAFIYTVGDAALVNLNDMIPCDSGWFLALARDINESGHIVGTGTFEGEVRSFLLVPTGQTTPTDCTQPVDGGGSSSSSSSEYFILSILGLLFIRRRFFNTQED